MQSLIQKPIGKPSTRQTTKMIEDTIKDSQTYLTASQLQTKLRGKVSQAQLRLILRKLIRENKIIYHKGKTIIWTYTDQAQEDAAKKHFVSID
jgi:phage tail sheath protein FI